MGKQRIIPTYGKHEGVKLAGFPDYETGGVYVEEHKKYLHGISFKEYQMSMDTTDITDEMWSKGERHLMKLLETQPMSDGSLQKRMQITDSFLLILTKITVPMLLISGKYDPVCTKDI